MDNKNLVEDYYEPFKVQKRYKLSKGRIADKEANKKRKLKHLWHGPEESKLVLGVKKRPALWDSSDAAYKIPSVKTECWEMIIDEIGIEDIDSNEAKNKWNSMRSNFKAYLGKFRSRKSNQTDADVENVTWPHFKEMLFLESAEIQSIASMSTIDFEDATTTDEISFLNNCSQPTDIIPSKPPNPPIFRPRRKRPSRRSSTPTPTPSPSPPPPPPPPSHPKETALKVLNSLHAKMQSTQYNDHFSAFGEVIAGNMRQLKPDEATELEIILSRVMYDYLDSLRTSSSRTESCHCIHCRHCRLIEKHNKNN